MQTTHNDKYELNQWYFAGNPAWNKSTLWQRLWNYICEKCGYIKKLIN